MESHGYSLKGDTITALRLVKDELNRIGGPTKFKIDRSVLQMVDGARSRYRAYLEAESEANKKEQLLKKKSAAEEQCMNLKQQQLDQIEVDINQVKAVIQASSEIIQEGNKKLQSAIAQKTLDKNAVVAAHTKIDMGLERKRKGEKSLVNYC